MYNTRRSDDMLQKTGYIEVPVEVIVKYTEKGDCVPVKLIYTDRLFVIDKVLDEQPPYPAKVYGYAPRVFTCVFRPFFGQPALSVPTPARRTLSNKNCETLIRFSKKRAGSRFRSGAKHVHRHQLLAFVKRTTANYRQT